MTELLDVIGTVLGINACSTTLLEIRVCSREFAANCFQILAILAIPAMMAMFLRGFF
jgi:hypothetical protein